MTALLRDDLRATALFALAGAVIGVLVLAKWWLAPLLLLAAVGLAIAVHRPVWLLPALFGAIYLEGLGSAGEAIVVIPVTLSKALAMAGLAVWVVHAAWLRLPLARWTPVTAGLLAISFTMVISIGAARDLHLGTALFPIVGVVSLAVMVHLVDLMAEPEDIPWLMRTMALALVAVLILANLGGQRIEQIEQRFAGTLGDPNAWCTSLIVAAPLLIGALVRDRWRWALPLLSVILVLFPLNVLLSLSRAGLLVTLILSPALLWLLRPRKGLVIAGLIAVAVIVPLLVSPSAMLDRYETLVDVGARENDGSLTQRADLVRAGLLLFKDHWATGVGAGMFRFEALWISSGTTASKVAHNTYLTAAVEQGVLGIASHAFLIWLVAKHVLRVVTGARTPRMRSIAVGYAISIVGFALMAATLDLITFAAAYFVLGVGLVLERANQRDPEALRAMGLG